MATKTYQDQLEEVQEAISRLIAPGGAQSVTVRSRSYTFADLNSLIGWEKDLRALADRETNHGGKIRVRGVTPV